MHTKTYLFGLLFLIFYFIKLDPQGESLLAYQDTLTVTVEKGWNLISLPVKPADARVSIIFPSAISQAYTYIDKYIPKDTLQYGTGYWIKFGAAETISIYGEVIVEDTIVLHKGWNLLGATSFLISMFRITTEPQNILSSKLYSFQQGSGYDSAWGFVCGKGYWLKAAQPGLLNRPLTAEAPRMTIVTAPPIDSLFILKDTTATWRGILFQFKASDRNSRWWNYSWRIDSFQWSPWSPGTNDTKNAIITASDMDPSRPFTGRHTFEVKARNEFGAVTPVDSIPKRTFNTVYPAFAAKGYKPRLLFIHHTAGDTANLPWQPSTETITNYYSEVLDSLGIGYDVWLTKYFGTPPLSVLGSYSTIYAVSDIFPVQTQMRIPGSQYSKYCDVGGNIIMNALQWPYITQTITQPENLLITRMHFVSIQPPYWVINTAYDFIGAYGEAGYPGSITLDSTKLNPIWNGALRYVAINTGDSLTNTIFTFNSRSDSTEFEGYQIGCSYFGPTYKTIYVGFPLYFVKKNDAIAVLRKSFSILFP